jgi:hypothetical protein
LPAGVCYPDTRRVRLGKAGNGTLVSEYMKHRVMDDHRPGREDTTAILGVDEWRAGHLSGSSTIDLAVDVTCDIDHSNGYFHQIGVLQRHRGSHRWDLIGAFHPRTWSRGPWTPAVTRFAFRRGVLIIHELAYGPKDPHCCPSLHVTVRWIYQRGRFSRAR